MPVPYIVCWFLLAAAAIANGMLRQGTYGRHVSELPAHQISTGTGILITGIIVWIFHRIWPVSSATEAWQIGLGWLAATVVFEFGFGHFVAKHPWRKLFADYNLAKGRVWLLFLIWITVMPYLLWKYD